MPTHRKAALISRSCNAFRPSGGGRERSNKRLLSNPPIGRSAGHSQDTMTQQQRVAVQDYNDAQNTYSHTALTPRMAVPSPPKTARCWRGVPALVHEPQPSCSEWSLPPLFEFGVRKHPQHRHLIVRRGDDALVQVGSYGRFTSPNAGGKESSAGGETDTAAAV